MTLTKIHLDEDKDPDCLVKNIMILDPIMILDRVKVGVKSRMIFILKLRLHTKMNYMFDIKR